MALIGAGCKGCEGSDKEAPGAAAEPARSDVDELEHRIATLNIDLKKTFPKRADGVVDCGTDADCFVVMAHRCEPAVVENRINEPGMLATKKVHALYRITGPDGEACRVLRLALDRQMALPDSTREILVKKGKTQSEIDGMLAEAQAYLLEHVAEKTVCSLSKGRALGLAVALATKEPVEKFFRPPCHDPGEGDVWPADLVAPAGAAPAAPTAPAPTTAPAAQ